MEALFVLSTQSNADVRRLPNGQTFDDTRWVSGEWHHHATKAHHAEPAQQYISKCGIIPYQIEFTSHSPAGKNKLSMRSFPNIMSSLFRPCLLNKKEKRKKKNSRYIIRRRAVVLLIRWCAFERKNEPREGSLALYVCVYIKNLERENKRGRKKEKTLHLFGRRRRPARSTQIDSLLLLFHESSFSLLRTWVVGAHISDPRKNKKFV